MADAYIVDAVRTAGGRREGALKDWHPVSMGAVVLDALVERAALDPAAIDDVIEARPHSNPLDTNVDGASRLLVDGPHFGVAWCVGAPPPLPANIQDIQLLPIDAPVGDVEAGECALLDSEQAGQLTSTGRFVLAWSTRQRSS